uniref:Uncharacterized protein n=1 Tax=Anopheles culicifacies TaxID=139723 RepID=A0A182MVJ7_9DIPT
MPLNLKTTNVSANGGTGCNCNINIISIIMTHGWERLDESGKANLVSSRKETIISRYWYSNGPDCNSWSAVVHSCARIAGGQNGVKRRNNSLMMDGQTLWVSQF